MRWLLSLILLLPLFAAEDWRIAMDSGKYDEAERLLKSSLEQGHTRENLRGLATLYRALARYSDAEPVLVELVATYPENDLESCDDKIELAQNYRATKQPEKAQPLISEVTSMHRKANGLKDLRVAKDLHMLAEVFVDLEQYSLAIQMFVQSIDISTEKLGRIHMDLLPSLDALGGVYREQANYPEAEGIYRWALTIRERQFGPMNAELIPNIDGLAYVMFGQRKYKDTEPFYTRLLNLWETSVGEDHPMVAFTLDKIAEFYYAQERWEDAGKAADRSLKIRETGYQQGVKRLARIYTIENRKEDAAALFKRTCVQPPAPTPKRVLPAPQSKP